MKSRSTLRRTLSIVMTLALLVSFLLAMAPAASAATLRDTVVTYGENDELLWALKRLTGVATMMKGNAHPDDENNAVMASMLLRDGVRPVCLTFTTGTGGQNAIGSEITHAYGAVRNLELAQSMNTVRADLAFVTKETEPGVCNDFGFSKRWEETYELWDWDTAFERAVRYFRTYRPDIFFEQGSLARSQHGQHQAVAMLCYAAYVAAADPEMFPEQITEEGLATWKVPFFTGSGTGNYPHAQFPEDFADGYFKGVVMSQLPATTVRYQSGNYVEDRFTGSVFYNGTTNDLKSSAQYGALSRQFHISQGMGGTPGAPGTTSTATSNGNALRIAAIGDEEPPSAVDLFDPKWGVPKTLGDLAKTGNEAVDAAFLGLQADVDAIMAAFPNKAEVLALVHGMIKDVNDAKALVAASGLAADVKYDLTYRLNRKLDELSECSQQAARLAMKLNPATWTPYAGQALALPVDIANNGTVAVNVTNVALNVPEGWTVTGTSATGLLAPGADSSSAFTVNIPLDAWYDYFDNTPVTATVTYVVGGVSNAYTFAYNDSPNWDWNYHKLAVMPQFSLGLSPSNYAVNTLLDYSELPVEVDVTSHLTGAQTATVSLDIPEGWVVTPASIDLSFADQDEVQTAAFTVIPGEDFGGEDRVEIGAKVVCNGVVSNTAVDIIEYEHIGRTYYLYSSVITIQGMEVIIPEGLKLGYVDGGRDLMYIYLEQVGFDVTMLTPEDILEGDLSQYDTIITGTRAYGTRSDLNTARARLLEYVYNGGNMVVNYQQPSGDGWNAANAPYTLNIGSVTADWRVVEENVKVNYLVPEHPILNAPNKIVDTDWDGWVQERSIYGVNFETSSPEWIYPISAIDTDDDIIAGRRVQKGMIATAPYGEGVYTYNTVVWYRQIQAVVPGSYRLLTNILSQNYVAGDCKLTDVSIMPASIVTGFAANIPVEASGVNLEGKALKAYLADGEGNRIGDAITLVDGKGVLKLAAAPAAGDYQIVVDVEDAGVSKAAAITVAPYNANIWTASPAVNEEGFLVIGFNADLDGIISAKEGGNVLACSIAADKRSVVTDFKPSAGTAYTIVISGVKYPALFPSYSFTFTLAYTYTPAG